MSGLVKHYQNTMQGIPQLGNTWGSMITLLDAVLVTGFNHIPVLGLTKLNATAITATINLGSSHGFIDRQVVRISGSTNGWDGDYKVLSVDGASITVECTAQHQSVILGTTTCFTAPLDFEIVYQTTAMSAEPKRAYRSTDPESLGLILLVHDFCVSGAAAAGAKFAKVGVVSGMSDINTITGTQMPFDSSNTNANWGWDGAYHGWAKWYYAVADGNFNNTGIADSSAPANRTRTFTITGCAEQGFAINIGNIGNSAGVPMPATYGYLEFHDSVLRSKNLALLCFGIGYKEKETGVKSPLARSSVVPFGTADLTASLNGGNLKGALWFSASGITGSEKMLAPPYLAATSLLTGIYATSILSDLVILDSSGEARGALPFYRTTTKNENAVYFDSDIGKYQCIFGTWSTNNVGTRYALLLEGI